MADIILLLSSLILNEWTRLAYNLNHPRMRAYVRSRYKDGGHTIRSAIAENSMLKTSRLYLLQNGSYWQLVLCCRIGNFAFFAAVMLTLIRWPSFVYEFDPYPPKTYPQTDYELSTSLGFRTLSYCIHTYRQTDMPLKTLPPRFMGGSE